MLRIKKGGQQRLVTKDMFDNKWKGMGFEIVKDLDAKPAKKVENKDDKKAVKKPAKTEKGSK